MHELVGLFKSKIWSYVESRTAALYHAADTHLARLDACQTRFVKELGMSEKNSLEFFNMAPLSTRRDIAMLGLIHRTTIGAGPSQFADFFAPAKVARCSRTRRGAALHTRQIEDIRNSGPVLEPVRRSALGLVAVYNLLQQSTVEHETVANFQAALQNEVKARAKAGHNNWRETFSPRLPLLTHPLQTWRRDDLT